MNSLLTSLPLMLPIAAAWVEKEELIICEQGTALTDSQLADARRAGVVNPEKIRVLRAETLPHPQDDDLMFVANRIGLFSSRSMGLTLGYGIILKHGAWECRHTLVHECVHIGQYERLGGIRPFLSIYIRECIDPGYPFGRLEQEAILISNDICKE